MNKIKTLKGTSLLSDIAIELYPSALKFYGDKYKFIIDDTLNRTVLYEWTKESPIEIIRDITKENVKPNQIKSLIEKEQTTFGFHYLGQRLFTGIEHFVVAKPVPNKDELRAILAHELYGHAVCSDYNTYVRNEGHLCLRNGIILANLKSDDLINNQAGEGMTEYIAMQIMQIYKPSFKRPKNQYSYNDGVEVASQLFKYVGKEKMLELLALGKGSIENLFDKENVYSWRGLASELESKEPDVDEYLDKFVKRYKYKNR